MLTNNVLDYVEIKDGRRGTLVEQYDDGGFHMEFCDRKGRTIDLVVVYPEDIVRNFSEEKRHKA